MGIYPSFHRWLVDSSWLSFASWNHQSDQFQPKLAWMKPIGWIQNIRVSLLLMLASGLHDGKVNSCQFHKPHHLGSLPTSPVVSECQRMCCLKRQFRSDETVATSQRISLRLNFICSPIFWTHLWHIVTCSKWNWFRTWGMSKRYGPIKCGCSRCWNMKAGPPPGWWTFRTWSWFWRP